MRVLKAAIIATARSYLFRTLPEHAQPAPDQTRSEHWTMTTRAPLRVRNAGRLCK